MSRHAGALEAVDRVLNRGGDAEAVLQAVADALHERVFAWVAVGPVEAGTRPARSSLRAGDLAAEPREPSPEDAPLLERVALLVSAHLAALRR